MNLGTSKKFDPSGEVNLSEGILPQIKWSVARAGYQQQKYIARRNHPRVLQRASYSLYYGTNSDIQILLLGNLG